MAAKNNPTSSGGDKTMICKGKCNGKPKTLSSFYKSNLDEYKVYGGYCPTCKTCLSKSVIDINANMVTMESIKTALKKVDKPFIEEVFNVISGKHVSNDKFLGLYIKQLNCYPKYKGLVYADTVDIQIEQEKIKNAKVEDVKSREVTDEMRLFWRNSNLSNQDYLDLQAMFDSYTKNEENMDYKKESDYRQLCKYELQKSKIEFDISSIAAVEKLQKMIDTLSDNLGIQAIQKQDEFDNNKLVLGLITRYYEDIKKDPIRRWVEDLGQLDPLRDIITTDYVGGLATAMGVTNPEIEDAKKRMEKYMVKLEEYFDEDGDMNGEE